MLHSRLGLIGACADLLPALRRQASDREIYATLLDLSEPFWGAAGEGDLSSRQNAVWQVDRHPKPFIALLGGPVGGTDLGLAIAGTHSVAAETASICVPDVHNSDTPAHGLSLALRRLPGHLGLYLALSCRAIDRALAYRAGLITHCIDAVYIPEIRGRLAQSDPVDEILDGLHRDPGPSPLDPYLAAIDACFGAPSPEDVVARLQTVSGPEAPWARALAHDIGSLSAAALDATFALLSGPPPPDLRSALTLEHTFARRRAGLAEAALELPPDPDVPSIS
jgi:enoyl-CoA hydratase